MAIRALFEEVVGFLRAGQPSGAPITGYSPLLALMDRRITDEEIATLATRFSSTGRRDGSLTDIRVAIFEITDALPAEIDVERLRRRLVADGWSIA